MQGAVRTPIDILYLRCSCNLPVIAPGARPSGDDRHFNVYPVDVCGNRRLGSPIPAAEVEPLGSRDILQADPEGSLLIGQGHPLLPDASLFYLG